MARGVHNGPGIMFNRKLPTILILAAAVFSAFSSSSARAADVAVFPLATTNVSDGDAAALGELLAQAYAAHSRQAVLSPARSAAAYAAAGDYQVAAAQLGVTEYLQTSAVGLGDAVVLQATRFDRNGARIHSAKLTAASLEDAPLVTDRLASALWHRTNTDQARTPRNVTEMETRATNRVFTEKLSGVRVGLHMPFARGVDETLSVSIGFNMRLESERYFLEFGAGGIIPTSAGSDDEQPEFDELMVGGIYAELGGSYLLGQGNVAPYIGGGIRPGINLAGGGDNVIMLAPFAHVGLTMPRESSTRFYTDLRFAQHVLPIATWDDYDLATGTETKGKDYFPGELMLNVGIGW